MTQEQFAMLMGVSRQSVTKWESGKSYPEMDKLTKMCDLFECSLDDLVKGDLTASAALKPDRLSFESRLPQQFSNSGETKVRQIEEVFLSKMWEER